MCKRRYKQMHSYQLQKTLNNTGTHRFLSRHRHTNTDVGLYRLHCIHTDTHTQSAAVGWKPWTSKKSIMFQDQQKQPYFQFDSNGFGGFKLIFRGFGVNKLTQYISRQTNFQSNNKYDKKKENTPVDQSISCNREKTFLKLSCFSESIWSHPLGRSAHWGSQWKLNKTLVKTGLVKPSTPLAPEEDAPSLIWQLLQLLMTHRIPQKGSSPALSQRSVSSSWDGGKRVVLLLIPRMNLRSKHSACADKGTCSSSLTSTSLQQCAFFFFSIRLLLFQSVHFDQCPTGLWAPYQPRTQHQNQRSHQAAWWRC